MLQGGQVLHNRGQHKMQSAPEFPAIFPLHALLRLLQCTVQTAQNSFSETFHSLLYQGLYTDRYLLCFDNDDERDFAVNFFTDALTISIRGWITKDTPETAEEYLLKIKKMFIPVVNSNIIEQNVPK